MMSNKMYSLGAVMLYLETEFGTILDKVQEKALKDMLNDAQDIVNRGSKNG